MKIAIAIVLTSLISGWPAAAQKLQDPPWNPEHIDRLPPEVRNAVLARCATIPQRGPLLCDLRTRSAHAPL